MLHFRIQIVKEFYIVSRVRREINSTDIFSATLGSTTGIISGTPSAITNYTGIVIRATDNSGDTADTNAFAINITA